MNLSILLDSFLFTACAAVVIIQGLRLFLSQQKCFLIEKSYFLFLRQQEVEVIYADRNLSSFAVLMK